MNAVQWYNVFFDSIPAVDDSCEPSLCFIDACAVRACVEQALRDPLERLRLRLACAAVGLGIAALAVSPLIRRGPANSKLETSVRQRLFAAIGTSHFAGVRLAGLEFLWRAELRGSIAEQREIAREIEARARRNPTPRALGDLGLLQLATGRFDTAVQLLERSTRRAPSDAGLRGDLDAVYLARGRALERPQDVVRALERIGPHPLALDSVFNRALALQSLYLNRLAKATWEQYLERDRDSQWGRIAAEYLHTLEASERSSHHGAAGSPRTGSESALNPPIQSSRSEDLQDWIEERGLGAWASAVLVGKEADRRATEQLLRQAAARLLALSGDRLPADEVEALAAAPAMRSRLLAKGLRDYVQARAWLDRYSHEKALAFFERAAERFRRASSPRQWWSEAGIAHCEMQLERYDAARRKAEQVLKVARRRSYVAVEARCDWVLAGIGLGTLDLNLARRNAVACHAIHQRAGNRTGTSTASLLLGRIDDELGSSAAAWLHRIRGFRDLATDGKDERLALAIGNASFALAREGELRAAADFASESLAFDRQQGTPIGLAESLWMRAMHRAKGGNAEEALADVREAKSHLPAIDSIAIRERILAGLHAVEGALLSESQPQLALEHLDAALGFLRPSGYEYGQAEILIDRARTLRRLGRPEDALADLDRAARIVATQRARLREPSLRVSFFNLQAELADERVATNVRFDPQGERAFWAADQARGLLFRGSLGLAGSGPLASAQPAARLSNQIGEADAVLAYWSLPDSLLIWIVRHNTPPRLVRQAISRDQLSQRISDFVLAVEEGAEPAILSPIARQLGQTLMAPVATELGGVRRLIVVPDRIVRAVPWPALELGSGEGPLLRRFLIRISPAAAMLGGPERSARRSLKEPAHVRLLALGAPEVKSSAEGAYVSLPGARREIEGIARLFADPVILTGREATRGRLLTELGRASIVHLASHFAAGRDPGSSRVVLAGAPGDADGSLDAETIARLSFPRLRLAVLSGCATNREAEPSLEGTFAAAGSFLAAGAAEVVATLWPVDDHFTAELMPRFYRELLAGYEVDEALRRAQLALLDDTRSAAHKPVHWAAFQIISLRSRVTELNFGREKK
ncbi:MAG: CHAT domain-containing protein [Thermoanaerobaculia bacterium]